jgi:outer membrane protein
MIVVPSSVTAACSTQNNQGRLSRVQKHKTTRQIFRIAAVAALSLFAPLATHALAQPAQSELEAYARAPEGHKVRLLIELARSGDHEFAAKLLDTYPLQGPLAANRTLFIEGLILKARGDLTGAAQKFRAALADDPKLTMVRAELAKTLVVLDQDDSAKHHLQLLAADAPDAQSVSAIRSFIDQVDAKRPYKFSGYVALAPSTNINNGSSDDVIYLPGFGSMAFRNQNSKKSGLGTSIGINGSASKRLGNTLVGIVSAGANANIYTDKDFNSAAFSTSAELRHIIAGGYISMGAVGQLSTSIMGNYLLVGKDHTHYTAFGPRLAMSKTLGLRDTIHANAVWEKRDNTHSTASDGHALLLDAGLTHAIDSSFTVSASVGYDKIKAESDQNTYDAWSVGAAVYKELPRGITLNAATEFRNANFDGIHFLTGDNRTDKRLTSRIDVTKRDLNLLGFAPSLSYTYTRNWSDVVLYDYDSHAIDFRLTKDF